ncbi:MAG: DUF1552 domain-containing protein [Polyangiaceae bacterium]
MFRSGRRMFLRGAAGFALAIPFLPSLVERTARAGSPPRTKRFIAMGTNHGGVWQDFMYPRDMNVLTQSMQYASRTIRRGALPLEVDGGVAKISDVLSGSSSRLTSGLASKMNLLRALDVSFYLAHHRGGHLGNYGECDGNGTDGQTAQLSRMPTIDQVMAWSNSFYPDLGSIKERSLVIGNQGMSANWSSPSTHTGDVQNITPEYDSRALFNKVFVPPTDPAEKRPIIVDRVMDDYRRLRDSNRRLSAADKQRLEDHLQRLDELDRKLNVVVECGTIQPPTMTSTDYWQNADYAINPDAQKGFWQLMNDVIVAAFSCDTSRIATMLIGDIFSNTGGDWHQDVAHQANVDAAKHELLWRSHQLFFEDVFLDLAAKLDSFTDSDGNTLLDNTLLQWTQESGPSTHDPLEMPVVTAGSAGGYLTTGSYVDYRDLEKPGAVANGQYLVSSNIGLLYNQWLGTVLQAMGLSPSEYETGPYGGYGLYIECTEGWYSGYGKYTDADRAVMGEVLPYLKA